MAKLELRNHFGNGGGHAIAEMSGTPKWYSEDSATFKTKLADRDNWWYHASADLLWSVVDTTGYMTYGVNRSDFASIRVTWEHVTWDNEKLNSDGSVTVDVHIDIGFFGGYPTSYAAGGYDVYNGLKFNGSKIAERHGLTTDDFFINPSPKHFDLTTTIQPEDFSHDMDLQYYSVYPNHEIVDASLSVGFALYNPNPPTYIPMAIRRDSWRSLNDNNGFIKIRHSGAWSDKSMENFNTAKQPNQGHNRIRRSGQWLQLPKM